eukprot:1680-Heterococcus_DN1.PRE.5
MQQQRDATQYVHVQVVVHGDCSRPWPRRYHDMICYYGAMAVQQAVQNIASKAADTNESDMYSGDDCCPSSFRAGSTMSEERDSAAAGAENPLVNLGILQNVLIYVGPGHCLFVKPVSKRWKDMYATLEHQQLTLYDEDDRKLAITIDPEMTSFSAAFASPSRVVLAHLSNLDCRSQTYQRAAGKYADVATLTTARALGMPFICEDNLVVYDNPNIRYTAFKDLVTYACYCISSCSLQYMPLIIQCLNAVRRVHVCADVTSKTATAVEGGMAFLSRCFKYECCTSNSCNTMHKSYIDSAATATVNKRIAHNANITAYNG